MAGPVRCSLAVSLAIAWSCFAAARADQSAADEFFEKEVRPLLVDQCVKCHGDKKPKGGLRLTSRATLLKGGDTGPTVVPGKPDESLLIQAIRYNDTPQMPPKRKLSDRQIAVLTRWVQLGCPWPETKATTATKTASDDFHITPEQRRFWAFQPLKPIPPPAVRNAAWIKSDLDRFILANL